MKFHASFDIKKINTPIHQQHQLFLMGSCFTENIGEKFRKHKFQVLENPNGILFNPVSVVEAIESYINPIEFKAANLFFLNDAWHSWKHHSRFSGITIEQSLQKINTSITQANSYLKSADYLMITLGSAWVYLLTEKASNASLQTVAANNHKAPSDWFSKKLMTVNETVSIFEKLILELKNFNPSLKIIFTISPVRHLREGVIENNRSKAVLIQSVHELVDQFNHLYYFPAYEIVLDDLRDYRFYAEDLVHPNYQATQYVWEKLIAACIDEPTQLLMKEIADINLAFQHKPFNEQSAAHKKFLELYLFKTTHLLEQHPYLDLKKEITYFNSGVK